ncbi:unnamed protein product [Mycena citricolor]|uniref:Uncharacterized protein n=1 Tax=Mycena citricolor TaxID=2018698 RepID=A0AAD2HQ81_9AGAR|nr:unnamed protein product [Mycena citricolor]
MEGPNGERVRGMALFDGASGLGVLDSTWFAARRHRLGNVSKPQKRLRMANGTTISSSAHWEGTVDVGGIKVRAEFEGGMTISVRVQVLDLHSDGKCRTVICKSRTLMYNGCIE